ncbi:MAG TPA: hypothetical protein VH327_04415 [Gammaproteobacteria bacterium]|jgi:hypothetical protein|nr:hypothetical protein [Gammaproteobacteria bacterium]
MEKKSWIPLALISIFIVIGIVLIIVRPDTTDEDADSKPTTFGADLAFHFDCKANPSEQAIEQFMTAKGFRTLDKVAAGKKLVPDFSWMKMDTVGVDSARRQITFKGFADQPGTYSASLFSEPPTHRSKDLEKDLLGFTEKTLGCKNSEVHHVENPAGAKDLYDHSFSVTETWYQQAAGIAAPAPTTATPPPSNGE